MNTKDEDQKRGDQPTFESTAPYHLVEWENLWNTLAWQSVLKL